MISCVTNEKQKKNAFQSQLSKMLNECEGFAIVVAKSYNSAYMGHCEYAICVRDSTGFIRESRGDEYPEIKVGDTLIKK